MVASVTVDSLASYTGATLTGTAPNRTFTFQTSSLSESAVQTTIDKCKIYVQTVIGPSMFDGSNVNFSISNLDNAVQIAWLDYTAFNIMVILSGGMITGGFDYLIDDYRVRRENIHIDAYSKAIKRYKEAAEQDLRMIMPMSLSGDGPDASLNLGQASSPYM